MSRSCRQIDSQYYQRVGWAKNPHKLAALEAIASKARDPGVKG